MAYRKEGDWDTDPLEKVLTRATMKVKENEEEARRLRALAAQHDEAAKMWAKILSGTSAEVPDNPFKDD